ncbi:MAG: DUF502 domain-containing protein [Alphaproteobacteria bacterium]|nr:DUF502 domain-containing protein [Alphaproteobacteria bacterium]
MPANTVPPTPAEPPPGKIGLLGRLRAYFLAGVLVTAPIGITSYLAWLFLVFVDDKIKPLIPAIYNPETYLPFSIPGLGLLALLIGLTMIGMLTAGFLGRALIRLGERIVARMPIVRGIYSASKQVIETVVGQNATSFREVVLVEFPRRGCWTIGFITGVTKGEIQRLTEDEVVNVFLPTTPNPTSGYLIFVPRQETVPLSMSVEDGIKLVVSGGIVTPPDPAAEGVAAGRHRLAERIED